MNTVKE